MTTKTTDGTSCALTEHQFPEEAKRCTRCGKTAGALVVELAKAYPRVVVDALHDHEKRKPMSEARLREYDRHGRLLVADGHAEGRMIVELVEEVRRHRDRKDGGV